MVHRCLFIAGASDFENMSLALPMSIAEGSSILKLEELTEQPHQVEQIYGHSEDFKVHEALWQCQSLFNEVLPTSHSIFLCAYFL